MDQEENVENQGQQENVANLDFLDQRDLVENQVHCLIIFVDIYNLLFICVFVHLYSDQI